MSKRFPKNNQALPRSESGGFTLVETLISLVIILLAVTPAIFAAIQGVSFASVSRDEVAAFYLAQEAVECIRNNRDNNALDPLNPPWLAGFDACPDIGDPCLVEPGVCTVSACTGDCPALLLDDGFYNYSAGSPTAFVRNAWITETEFDKEARIEVEVKWSNRLISRTATTSAYIENWQ